MAATGKALIFDKAGANDFVWNANYSPSTSLGKNEVLLKVISAGLNPIDYKLAKIPGMWSSRKNKPVGMDVCGTVVSVGKAVTSLAPGDVVFGAGAGMSEYTVASAAGLVKVPEGAKDIPVYGGLPVAGVTAYQILKKGGAFTATQPMKILVIGASGGVGACVVQMAKAKCPVGTTVAAICSGKSAEYVTSIGADSIIDYTKPEYKFATCVEAKSLDLVLDCVTSPDDYNFVPEGLKLIKEKTGKYVAINSGKNLDWIKLMVSNATGIKLFRGQYELHMAQLTSEDMAPVGAMVHSGQVKINVQEYVPLEEAALRKAYDTLMGRRVRGKLIMKV